MASEDPNLSGAQDDSQLAAGMGRLGLSDGATGADGEHIQRTEEEYAEAQLTLRAIVSSKEAGVIIGKAGKNVADLRDETGVRAGVSKVVPGVHDRVLTVTGGLRAISRAYHIVAKGLLEGAPQMGMGGVITGNGTHRKSYLHSCLALVSSRSVLALFYNLSHILTQVYPSSCSPSYIT
jgi:heterogeneous nuclear rnp K-like protein